MFGKDNAAKAKVIKEVIKAYSYVLLWMSISCSVIMFNKWVLAYSGFPFPLALTLWHMVFCSTVGFLAVRVFKSVKSHNMSAREYCNRVLPIGILYAGSLWLSNSAYLYLSVSFIQMTKSLMPGLVYASGVMLGTEKLQNSITLNMLLIAFGVVVCAAGELNLVLRGLIQQLAALGFEALRLTMVQILINSKGLQMNPIQSLYYVSPACMISLLAPFCIVELNEIRTRTDWVFNPSVMVANALTAFILNLAVFLLIGKTSALTMNIAGVIKDWMLIFFSWSIFKAPVTALNLLGYIFCCSGVVVYNHIKLQAIKQRVAQGSKGDEEKGRSTANGKAEEHHERSKEDILSEIRRLQGEMSALEDRVQVSTKLMGGDSDKVGEAAAKSSQGGAEVAAMQTAGGPEDSKDK